MEELLKTARSRGRIEVLQSAISCAIRTGRLADAWALRKESADLMGEAQREPQGRTLIELAVAEWHLGDRTRARAAALDALQLMSATTTPNRLLVALAEVGEVAQARRLLARAKADQPKGTALTQVWGPLTESILLLRDKRADAALNALHPAERFERRWGEIGLQRARATMEAGDTAATVSRFRELVDNPPTWPPAAAVYPAALVGLARALAASGDTDGARKAYAQCLELWKQADSNLRLLVEVRQEVERLGSPPRQ